MILKIFTVFPNIFFTIPFSSHIQNPVSNFVATSCDHVRRAGEQIYAREDPDRQWHPRRNQEGEPLLIRQLDRAMVFWYLCATGPIRIEAFLGLRFVGDLSLVSISGLFAIRLKAEQRVSAGRGCQRKLPSVLWGGVVLAEELGWMKGE